jgi:phosphoribosylaminoimidazolecarboxamide formyltransferase/IMP cyclohydrolase
VLVTNAEVDEATAQAINELFFEVLLAPAFSDAALTILQSKKNRILLQTKAQPHGEMKMSKSVLNGVLSQERTRAILKNGKKQAGPQQQPKKKTSFLPTSCASI